ncbi:hypothetical protein FBULB1_533 [Fusarium bulbicola]|nr:hypothetical protein FBULB1_533 [Fusarium bulbicola]
MPSITSLVPFILASLVAASPVDQGQGLQALTSRDNLCCALAEDNRNIQLVCQYMYENCGSWTACIGKDNNDSQWCHYCVVSHPEDPACLKLTWPPANPAPVGKRSLDNAAIPPLEALDSSKDNTVNGDGLVRKQATQYIQTRALVNEAQSYARVFGLVTVRIIVSALNVVTYSIQNAGAAEFVYEILDQVTGWKVNGNIGSGEVFGGHASSQVLAKGGDRFEVDVN